MNDTDRTNIRGETPAQAFGTAITEAFAPLLRDAIHGREISAEEARERLEHQLKSRGFDVKPDTETAQDGDSHE